MRTIIICGSIVIALGTLAFFISKNKTLENSTLIPKAPEIMQKSAQPAPEKPRVTRRWEVLDPEINAESILIESLDANHSYIRHRVAEPWHAASLSKLLTTLVVKEDIGLRTKVTITDRAEKTEGIAGKLKKGEQYLSEDLIKIMLLASSNDAAVAFEDYSSSTDDFVRLMTKKALKIGMTDSVFFDASGLSDHNSISARDVSTLMRYIIEKHPDILGITRLQEFIAAPLNTQTTKIITNINPLAQQSFFLGGKTGTSNAAKQNLVAIIETRGERILIVILGSADRITEMNSMLSWIENAYTFNAGKS